LHGSAVLIFLALTVVSLGLVWRSGGPGAVDLLRRGEVLVGVLIAQGAIGYIQYFTRIPPLLVGFHIAGAVSVWLATLWFVLGLRTSTPAIDLSEAAEDTSATVLART